MLASFLTDVTCGLITATSGELQLPQDGARKAAHELFGPQFALLRERADALLVPRSFGRHVEIDPSVKNGLPVIRRTSIQTETIHSLHANGLSHRRIKDYYPHLSHPQIVQADRFEHYLDLGQSSRVTLRFLTDTQTPQPLVEMLRALGWDVRTVYEEGTEEEQDDVNHLIKARSLGRVLITFDQLRAESGARVAAELLLGGGKLIQITRDPAQDLHRALGRLLFHYPDWCPFLDVSHGVAVVSDINRNPRLYTPRQYSQTVSSSSKRHFEEYVAAWEVKRREPSRVRRRRLPSSEQTRLNLP